MRTLAAFLVVAHAFVSPGRRLLAPRRLAAPTSNEGCEVYVGNIARQTDEQALREAFEERYGEVNGVRLPGSAVGDAHRGFGFVTFALRSAASAAIASGRVELAGRKMVVSALKQRASPARAGAAPGRRTAMAAHGATRRRARRVTPEAIGRAPSASVEVLVHRRQQRQQRVDARATRTPALRAAPRALRREVVTATAADATSQRQRSTSRANRLWSRHDRSVCCVADAIPPQ